MMPSQTVHTDKLREFAVAVSDSLGKVGQRELPSMYLYDELGTALFEAITLLPEYGLTRAELRLLSRHAGAIVEHLPPPVSLIELGSGSGGKTRWILEARADRGAGRSRRQAADGRCAGQSRHSPLIQRHGMAAQAPLIVGG